MGAILGVRHELVPSESRFYQKVSKEAPGNKMDR